MRTGLFLTVVAAGLITVSFWSGAKANTGMTPSTLPMVWQEASIVVVRVVQVIDRGEPETDKPIILRVKVEKRLRDYGSGLPDEFLLERAPRVALPTSDCCSGRPPRLAYENCAVPKVGATQIVAANMTDAKTAMQEGTNEEATPERVAAIKKEVDELAGVKSNFYQEAQRLYSLKQLKDRSVFESKWARHDYSKVVAASTDIAIVEYEDDGYSTISIPAHKARVIKRILDSGTEQARKVDRPMYLYGETVPVTGKFIVFLKCIDPSKRWAPPTVPFDLMNGENNQLLSKILFSYRPASTDLIGVSYTPQIEKQVSTQVAKLKRGAQKADPTVHKNFSTMADLILHANPKECPVDLIEKKNLQAVALIKNLCPADHYVVHAPVQRLVNYSKSVGDRAKHKRYSEQIQRLSKTAPYIEHGHWHGWKSFHTNEVQQKVPPASSRTYPR